MWIFFFFSHIRSTLWVGTGRLGSSNLSLRIYCLPMLLSSVSFCPHAHNTGAPHPAPPRTLRPLLPPPSPLPQVTRSRSEHDIHIPSWKKRKKQKAGRRPPSRMASFEISEGCCYISVRTWSCVTSVNSVRKAS